MPKFRFDISLNDENEATTVEGEFEQSEWDVLERYSEFSDQLLGTTYFGSAGFKGGLNVHWDPDGELRITATTPPGDQIAAFLHHLRPFVLNGEPTNFRRTCNLVSRRSATDPIRKLIGALKTKFAGKNFQSQIKITSNGVVINSDEVLNLWLNSHQYHRDQDKAEVLASLHQLLPMEGSIPLFLMLLTDKAEAIVQLSNLIKVIQGKIGTGEDRVEIGNLMRQPLIGPTGAG